MTVDGERFEGNVMVHREPTDFVGIVERQRRWTEQLTRLLE